MANETSRRKRSSKAYILDKKVDEVCQNMLLGYDPISARAVSRKLDISASSITRDNIRSKILADAKRQQQTMNRTTSRQVNRSREKDAKIITAQRMEIEKLQQQNDALLASHKALYNVIREIGGKEAWERFFETALDIKNVIIDIGGTETR